MTEQKEKEALLQKLREEVEGLLRADNVCENEKVARMLIAQAIIQHGIPEAQHE